MADVPHERSLVKRLEGKPFALLGINSDENREKLKKLQAKESITWRSWWDGGSVEGPIAEKWNVQSWPTMYLLDSKGVIRYKSDSLRTLNIRTDKNGVDRQVDFLDEAVDEMMSELESGKKP